MKEWDLDAYVRRWRNSYGFFSTGVDKPLQYGYFAEFWTHGEAREKCGVSVIQRDKTIRYSLEDASRDYPTIRLEYIPIAVGWYNIVNGLMGMLMRMHHRGYHVGLSAHNHTMVAMDKVGKEVDSENTACWSGLELLRAPSVTPYAPGRPFGVLSRRLWYRHDQLYFLKRCIGEFKGEKLIVENNAFIPYIKPFVGETCQIVAL